MRFVVNRDFETGYPAARFWKSFDAHHFSFSALAHAKQQL